MSLKCLGDIVKPIKTECWRITALLLCSLGGPVLCCNVYMPTDYGTMESFVEYALNSLFCSMTLMPPLCWLRVILIVI